ncbi:MAG: hypothetical protein AB7D05_07770 [Mangrovibacterium sp.]
MPRIPLNVQTRSGLSVVRLEIGKKLIPLGQLRKRLNEMPEDKNAGIITWSRYLFAVMKPLWCFRQMGTKM